MVMIFKYIIPASITSVMLALAVFGIDSVYASPENVTMAIDNNATATTPVETQTTNASKMVGVIASIQRDEAGSPAWITAGHWNLESDAPLIGEENMTQPQINNFSATIYMVANADGTAQHPHEISDFAQTAVLHVSPNEVTVNGTFTVTMPEGPVEDVEGYVHIINDKLEFWVDPVPTNNHFGPTTITGLVLSPEMFDHADEEMMDTMPTTQQGQYQP
jgi:hypothetical protein